MASRRYENEEVVIPENVELPMIGATMTYLNQTYRCVSVAYADGKETGGVPEIRVRFRQEEA